MKKLYKVNRTKLNDLNTLNNQIMRVREYVKEKCNYDYMILYNVGYNNTDFVDGKITIGLEFN